MAMTPDNKGQITQVLKILVNVEISGMGFKTPHIWKDELYLNGLSKLDVKRELDKGLNGS